MGLGLNILGLLIMFLLIIVYFSKNNLNKDTKLFGNILLSAYVSQFCYLVTYIIDKQNGNIMLISKLYLISIILYIGLFSLYLFKGINEKKIKDDSKMLNKINTIFIVSILVSILIIFISNLSISSGFIGISSNVMIVLISIYLIIDIIILFMGIKDLDNKKIGAYSVSIFAFAVMFNLQNTYSNLGAINGGLVLITLYLYLVLESTSSKEIETLKLERDYAIKHSIDKNAFLKNLSHQIRTPLNTIDGFSQIITDSDKIEDIKADVNDIRLASKDLINVINGMIDLENLMSGNLEIISEDYNVYDMLDNISAIANSKMRDIDVKFITDVEKDIPEVLLGDNERISQIILNLITNSIKYTTKGNIILNVNGIKSSNICRLKITVSDTGRGIEKDELKSIFENSADNRIGLCVSKYLVELMGGNIEIDSNIGRGTTVVVTIDQKIVSEKAERKVNKKNTLRAFDASDKRILLVDDNKLNLKVANKLLESYKVEIVEANSGKECLDILDKDTNFDLILMDDLMPEMSGTECLDIMKKIERVDGYYIPVVVLTANAVSGMREKYLNSGFEDYLAKPIDKYELDRIMKKYLKGKK